MSDTVPTPTDKLKSGTAIGLAAAGLVFGALSVVARKAGISRRALIVRNVALPLVAPRTGGSAASYAKLIAADRKRGPGLPSRSLRARYEFIDEKRKDRTLMLAPKGGATSRTRILYLHGGAYVFDISFAHWNPIASLVDQLDAKVVAPLYPLAPESTWEAGMACAERCYERLVAEVGAGNVVIAGDSAGGGLTLALTQRLRDAGRPLPAALVLFSPWLDITVSGSDQPPLAELDTMLNIDDLREAGRMWAGNMPPHDPAVSPLFGDQSGLPPTIVFCGTHDLLVSDARRFVALSPQSEYHEYPGMFHCWVGVPIPEAKPALRQAAAFITAKLRS